jgi:oligopeptide transport system substrate-binding protein
MLRLLVLCAAFAPWLGGCAKKETAPPAGGPAPAAPQVLRVSQRNEPADLDPARVTLPDEFGLLRNLLEGLLVPGPDGTPPRPGVAARHEVSADGLTHTFHLRRDARWSNGDPVTAADFVASARRQLTPAVAAPKAGVFFDLKNARAFLAGTVKDFAAVGIRAADAHTLVVALERPVPRFAYVVASGPWLPVHTPTVEKFGRRWTDSAHFVGNGPFVLAEWRAQQRLVLRRNPHWHGAAALRLDELQFLRFDSGNTEEQAYRAGQVDVTLAVPLAKVEVYARERPAELHRAPMMETRYLVLNTQRPALRDPRVRRALLLALDRARLVDRVTRGSQPFAPRLLPPALAPAGAAPAAVPADPAAARALLQAAGVDPKALPKLELSAWSASQLPLLEAIQAVWKQELGLDVALATRDAKVHLAALAAGDYDLGFITAIPDLADPANVLADFLSGAPENYAQWRDADFDAAFARGDLAAAEARLLDATAVIPLYFNTKIWLMSPRVRGWSEDGLWSPLLSGVHLAPP